MSTIISMYRLQNVYIRISIYVRGSLTRDHSTHHDDLLKHTGLGTPGDLAAFAGSLMWNPCWNPQIWIAAKILFIDKFWKLARPPEQFQTSQIFWMDVWRFVCKYVCVGTVHGTCFWKIRLYFNKRGVLAKFLRDFYKSWACSMAPFSRGDLRIQVHIEKVGVSCFCCQLRRVR